MSVSFDTMPLIEIWIRLQLLYLAAQTSREAGREGEMEGGRGVHVSRDGWMDREADKAGGDGVSREGRLLSSHVMTPSNPLEDADHLTVRWRRRTEYHWTWGGGDPI